MTSSEFTIMASSPVHTPLPGVKTTQEGCEVRRSDGAVEDALGFYNVSVVYECARLGGPQVCRGVDGGLGDICSSFGLAANTKAIKVTEVKSTHGTAAALPPHTYPLLPIHTPSPRNALQFP
ncbi:hypothetical protein SRHO_G00225790 [Serrasalmus rhombeus]